MRTKVTAARDQPALGLLLDANRMRPNLQFRVIGGGNTREVIHAGLPRGRSPFSWQDLLDLQRQGIVSIRQGDNRLTNYLTVTRELLDRPLTPRHISWIHFSDWHQGKEDIDRRIVRDALVIDIGNRSAINRNLKQIDLGFFSGDLAWSGDAGEYERAQELFVAPILDALKIESNRFFFCPGNHDLEREAISRLPAAIQTTFKTDHDLKEWVADHDRLKELLLPFENFRYFALSHFSQTASVYGTHHTVELAGIRVSVLGLNSAMMCARHYEMGEVDDDGYLVIGEPQIYDSIRLASESDLVIALERFS